MLFLVNVMLYPQCLHVFKTQTSQVVTQAASSRARIVPLKMGFEDREETVSEATKRYEPIPAVYKNETQAYCYRSCKHTYIADSRYIQNRNTAS